MKTFEWVLGFVGLAILIFWAFSELGKTAKKNHINNEIDRIKDELNRQVDNTSRGINNAGESISLLK